MTAGNKTKPQKGKAIEEVDTRQRILDAATHLFATKGFGATGVREIAGTAGANLAMINYFFGSKKGLLKEILSDFLNRYLEAIGKAVAPPGSMEQKLDRVIHRIVDFFMAEPEKILIMLTEMPHDDPEILEFKSRWIRELYQLFNREMLEDLKEKQEVEPPLEILGPALVCMTASHFLLRDMIRRVRPEAFETLTPGKLADTLSTLYVSGLNGVIADLTQKANQDDQNS